ncbi:glycosyltransferase family 1 protein [Stenotrophomonas sp. ATCM1_4]|uniref:Glycosyltransferase family 1 protein n=1 Tax=Stenotrophomonas capsici TaxID=3110230 RepID=A0ABU5V3R6_9GAMM|nr:MULTISPECIES: glycosyltransferase family 1 protein [unclassified Stenotrophomonas]MEA5667966.1 glycosyltransferase family 1 protein [Stenotrophomonas sp. MH1]TDB28587.1 glycosyltransferase family 1 protein [Stenotrophomonas sp. ATCM1_4]
MRIGIDYRPVTAAPYSGIARQVLALEQALLASGRGELVRFSMAPLQHPHRAIACCPAQDVPAAGLHRPQARLAFEIGFLPKALAGQGIDLYIATANSGLPWPRPRGLKHQVQLLHDLFQLTLAGRHASWLHGRVYGTMDRTLIGHALRAADAIWTPSQYSAGQAARLFPRSAGKLAVLPNAVAALATPDPLRDPTLPRRYWLVVGTREPRKNIPFLLEHWQALRDGGLLLPDLVLVGDPGDVPEWLADLPGLHWRSGLSDAALSRLYHDAERLWHPATAEGFGLPVIEALACGTPVAVATGSALDEITPRQALRFDPRDADALREALRDAATGRRAEESVAVLQAAAARYAPAHYQQRVLQLLDEVLR